MKAVKEFTFSAAHKLEGYDGPCANLHGHTYRVIVEVEGFVDEGTGMLIDFATLSDARITLDHSYLNDFIEIPTAENIAICIGKQIAATVEDNVQDITVTVWETPTSHVIARFKEDF